MNISDILLLSMFISALGVIIFMFSIIINFFKHQDTKTEWKRVGIFMSLTLLFFVLFGVSIS